MGSGWGGNVHRRGRAGLVLLLVVAYRVPRLVSTEASWEVNVNKEYCRHAKIGHCQSRTRLAAANREEG